MRDIRLLKLTLRSFKGLGADPKDPTGPAPFVLEPLGRDVTVRGDNATGKTTLLDAYLWLLTGKDSAGRQDCSVKTLGAESAEHAVEALLDVDGVEATLSRTYKEKWVRRRGAPSAELQGHATSYQVDGVPMKQKEWDARLAELLPEQTWLLSVPGAFAALHWQERRNILLGLTGDLSTADVIASTPDLEYLAEAIGKRTPDEHRRVAGRNRKAANLLLTQIPARVDEITRQLAPLADLDRAGLESSLAEVEADLADARAGIDEGGARKRAALETRRLDLADRIMSELRAADRARGEAIRVAKADLARAQMAERSSLSAGSADMRLASVCLDRAAALRVEYSAAAAPVDDIPGTCTCAACGDVHAVAPDRLEAARAAASLARAERLKEIQRRGRAAMDEAGGFRDAADAAKGDAHRHADKSLAAEERLKAALAPTPEHIPLHDEVDPIAAEIAALDAATPEPPDTAAVEARGDGIRADLARLDGAAALRVRLAELADERKRAGAALEQAEHELDLLDRFASAQAEVTEARVNGLFGLVKFRLWRPQINGGVDQCCDILVDGVPAGAGLNNGAEINAGLDVIRTLGQHWGVKVPVFVDNSEGVTRLPDIGSQMIRLAVVEGVDPMTVSYGE